MTRARRHAAACLAVAGVLFTLAACTGQPDPTPSAPAQLPAAARADINPHPRDALRDGGLLRLPITALPHQWNPRHPDADADTRQVLAPLTPPHVELDAAGRPTANPDFVTAIAVTHDANTVVTLSLNDSAVWGDAAPVTATDWVATWQAAVGAIPGVTLADAAGWDRVTDVHAGDGPHEVVLTYAGVDPDWAEPLVAGPSRADALASGEAFSWATPDDARHAAAFMVTHVDTVQGLVTLERNPLWWGDRPRLDTIMFRTVPDEAVAAAFQHNELDMWETGSDADGLEQSRVAADTELRTSPGTSGRTLDIGRSGVLADPVVRQAIVASLDPVAVAESSLPPAIPKAPVWANTLLLPTQPGYSDQAVSTGLGHDPVRAGELLDEAGWESGGGVRSRDGAALTLTFSVPAADERAEAEFEVVQDQLEKVGATLTRVAGAADLTPRSRVIGAFPLAHPPPGAGEVPGATPLIEAVAHQTDAVRRADQASQLARLLWQDVLEIPLYQEPQIAAVRQGLANLGSPGHGTTAWEDVGWTS